MQLFPKSLALWIVIAILPAVTLAEEGSPGPKVEASVSPPKLTTENPLESKLESTYLSVDFEQTPLQDVCEFLAEVLKIDIVLDHNALSSIGVAADTPVTLKITQEKVPADKLLSLILRQVTNDMVAVPREGYVLITDKDEAAKLCDVVVYKVSDLLVTLPNNEKSETREGSPNAESGKGNSKKNRKETAAKSTAPQAGQLGGFSGNVFSCDCIEPTPADNIINLITFTIEPTSWADVGGLGTIEVLGDVLVISQTPQIHRQIRDLLNQIRAAEPAINNVRPRPPRPFVN